ncbi:hypothetical protein [Priestia aryabhattai]|uniref:hypothetical protein n=1 Tax=Priestia aryabhattai TaxID=412384 RepID=UPI000532BFFE|nr:hypothetical protein [Priestia aryabhattai]
MLKEKILFLEQKKYYEDLGFLDYKKIKEYDLEFDGNKNYKLDDSTIKTYKFVVSALYHDEVSNFLVLKAIKNNVKTILLGDGIIDWANMFEHPFLKKKGYELYHPILQDSFLCVGSFEKKYFEFLGVNAYTFLPKRILDKKEKIPITTQGEILITTANTAYFSEYEFNTLIDLLDDLLKELSYLKDKIYFRIFDSRIVNKLNISDNRNLINGSFENILKDFDIVVSTPSSIVLNAMYHGRAVAQLLYRDNPIFLQSGWYINHPRNIKNTLEDMIVKNEHRMIFQQFIISEYINSLDDNEAFNKEVKNIKKVDFNETLYKMLNSKFNINFSYFARNSYLKFKKVKLVKKIAKKIKS